MRCRIVLAFAAILFLLSITPLLTGPVDSAKVTVRTLSPLPMTNILGILVSVLIITGLAVVYRRSRKISGFS